jgi:ERCC4-type nuclease
MNIELIIDNRENIKELFSELITKESLNCSKVSYDISIKYENLDLGDYVIKINTNPVLVIERKTVNDLAQSIRDGRHREQKKRLLSTYEKSQILFLIEGNIFANNQSYNQNKIDTYTIISSIFNTMYRDGLHVIFSYRDETTVELIKNILKKIIKNGGTLIDVESGGGTHQEQLIQNTLNSIKIKKKDNLNSKTSLIAFLSSIPNISPQFATELADCHNFNSVNDLIVHINKNEDKNKSAIELCEKHYESYKKRRQLKSCQDIISFLFS